jgi:hypothetical protein
MKKPASKKVRARPPQRPSSRARYPSAENRLVLVISVDASVSRAVRAKAKREKKKISHVVEKILSDALS